MQDMVNKLFNSMDNLKAVIDKRYEVSEKRAVAEYNYRERLGREMAEAKVDGMAATALYNYCRGLPEVAKLREERDILIAQEDYLSEMIFYWRSSIRVYEGEVNAERKGL